MDIKPTRQNLNSTIEPNRQPQERAKPADNSNVSSTDTVTVTETASRVQELEASLSTLPDVDSAKVQAIRQAISEGRYQVDTDRIASNLLKLEQELL